MSSKSLLAATFILLALSPSCTRRIPQLPITPTAVPPPPGTFIDLQPGWRLLVITPLLRSGGNQISTSGEQVSGHGNTLNITASAGSDFVGYESACYMVVARSAGRVQLQFSSAEFVQDGKAVPRERPAAKLFRLPRNARYMRLIYLIHLSHADHEMALVTATEPAGLDALTREVQLHPATGCRSSRGRVCIWIPPGIAVRPEVRKTVNGVEQWLPAL